MAELPGAAAQQPVAAKAQVLNDRTYQEVEYLKKNLGPILVAALAEICIRRPADPIEYLGHWLLRWRYNEELKRRDVQNALEVVRQRALSKDDGAEALIAQTLKPESAVPLEGTLFEQPPSAVTSTPAPAKSASGEEKRPSPENTRASLKERRASGGSQSKTPGGGGSQEFKRASAEPLLDEEKPPSEAAVPRASGEMKRTSGEVEAVVPSGEVKAEGTIEEIKARKSGVTEEPSAVDAAGSPTQDNVAPPPPAESVAAPEGEAPPE